MSIVGEIKDSFKNGSVLTRLIYINIGVFLFIRLVQLFLVLSGYTPKTIDILISFFAVPSTLQMIVARFWTPITYMFTHYDFLHLLFNILFLYWFGKLFMSIISPRLLLRVYILGGLAGVLFYFLGLNFIPAFSAHAGNDEMIGASGAVMAILFSTAVFRPNFSVLFMFIGQVRLKYVALVAFISDLVVSLPQLINTGGILAHLGGSAFGVVFGLMLLSGKIQINTLTTAPTSSWKPFWQKKSKLNVSHKRALTDMEYNAIKVRRQKEVDRILEKIKNSGYESLSESEKKTLFEASKDSNFR